MPRSWPQPFTSRPSTSTRPPLAVSSPLAMRNAVVLPQPDGPISETISPSRTVKLTRWSACTICGCPPTRSEKRFETSTRLTSPIKRLRRVGNRARLPRGQNCLARGCPRGEVVQAILPTLRAGSSAFADNDVGGRGGVSPSMPRQELQGLLARRRIHHLGGVDRLRQAADADRHFLDVVELVHRDRQVGADRVRLD